MEDGTKVANFRIATTERWKDKTTGEQKSATEWHGVNVWGGLATVVERYVKKGSQVYVEGSLHTRKYTDKEGVDRWSTEVKATGLQLLDPRNDKPADQ